MIFLKKFGEIFSFAEEFFISRGIDSSLRFSVDLAVDELFTNMVKYNASETADIEIEFKRLENGLKVTMTDHEARPFDVTREGPEVDVDQPAGERDEGGLGLHLVKEMVDTFDYEYRDGRCTITFTKKPD